MQEPSITEPNSSRISALPFLLAAVVATVAVAVAVAVTADAQTPLATITAPFRQRIWSWLFPRRGALIVQKYKEDVRDGRHQKIEEKIRRLGNTHGKGGEIYVERKYKAQDTGAITTNIEELVKEN